MELDYLQTMDLRQVLAEAKIMLRNVFTQVLLPFSQSKRSRSRSSSKTKHRTKD